MPIVTSLAPESEIGQIVIARIVIEMGSRADDPDDLWIFPKHRIAYIAVQVINAALVVPPAAYVPSPYRVIFHAAPFTLVASPFLHLATQVAPVFGI